jgi:nucleoside-diphosphate-sugar epimerase
MSFTIQTPITVTGATGYVASHVIHELLQRGTTVHGTVRNLSDEKKTAHLKRMGEELPGSLKLFQADLLQERSFQEAIAGCGVVIHMASPFVIGTPKNPQATLVDPALKGTRNVLETVNTTDSVKRVVLTSSTTALFGDAEDCDAQGGTLTEEHWNETNTIRYGPYQYSKKVAEAEAWKLAKKQQRWNLVTINPGFVMGPSLTMRNDSSSIDFLLNLINGKFANGIWQFYTPWVDVRDVAFAHAEAAVRPNSEGRHILSCEETGVLEVVAGLKEDMPGKLKLPRSRISKWMAYLIGPFMGFSWRYISHNVDIPVKMDNSRSIERLGIIYRPLRVTMREHVEQLIRDGLYKVQDG